MKNFNEKLKKVLKEKGRSQKSLSMAIGMSEAGFVQMVNNNSIKVETLEKICTELDLPIAYFLDIELEIQKPVQDDGSIWKRMLTDMNEEISNWRLRAYKAEELLKQHGIANFRGVSKQVGVGIAA